MRNEILFIALILISINPLISIGQDSSSTVIPLQDPIRLIEEIQDNRPPCGIPCSHQYDEKGSFMSCLSPCCNCNEIYFDDRLLRQLQNYNDTSSIKPQGLSVYQKKTDTIEVKFKNASHFFDNSYSLQIDSIISDSRCPVDAKCKWAGNAEARFLLRKKQGTQKAFILNTNTRFETEVTIDNIKFEIIGISPKIKTNKISVRKKYNISIQIIEQ